MGKKENNMLNQIISKKMDINCGVYVVPIINYIEKSTDNMEYVKKTIEELGISIDFLLNKKNWVSYEYFCSLLKLLISITGDKNAPKKIYSTQKPDVVLKDIANSILSTMLFNSPKLIYKILLNKNISQIYLKIGTFEEFKETKNEITFKYNIDKEKEIDENFCKFIEGYLSCRTIVCGLATVKVSHQIIEKNSCLFNIKWDDKTEKLKLTLNIIFFIFLMIELYLYKIFFSMKDIIITITTFISLNFTINYIKLKKSLSLLNSFNIEKDTTLLDTVTKIEREYNELLEKEKEIVEKNLYLTIMNDARKLIYYSIYFTPLLLNIAKIFLDNLNFLKAVYFEYNHKKRSYDYLFELNSDIIDDDDNSRQITFSSVIFSAEISNFFSHKEKFGIKNHQLEKYLIDYGSKFNFSLLDDYSADMLFIDIPNSYSGFFIFFYKEKCDKISHDIITLLFDDISDLLKISHQNISSKLTIENILSSIPSFVIIFDINNFSIKFVNDLFITSFPFTKGEKREDIIDKQLFSVIPFKEEDIYNVKSYITYEINDLRSKRYETLINNYVFEYNLFRIPNFKSMDKLVGLIINDITEAKYFWKNIIINEKLLALGRVASGIAHEINNPLYAVLANAEEIADKDSVDDETKKYAQEIIEHVINVSNIIKDLSSFSKTLRKEEIHPININNVIEDSLKLVKYSSNYLEIEVIKNLNELPLINASKGELQQIFINIFINSIQAMKGKGKLTVSSFIEKKKIKITIADTGCGISKKDLPYIFDLYFSTKSIEEGSGQGLHIVKKIMEKYNGKIKVESKVGYGTTFTLILDPELLGVAVD